MDVDVHLVASAEALTRALNHPALQPILERCRSSDGDGEGRDGSGGGSGNSTAMMSELSSALPAAMPIVGVDCEGEMLGRYLCKSTSAIAGAASETRARQREGRICLVQLAVPVPVPEPSPGSDKKQPKGKGEQSKQPIASSHGQSRSAYLRFMQVAAAAGCNTCYY